MLSIIFLARFAWQFGITTLFILDAVTHTQLRYRNSFTPRQAPLGTYSPFSPSAILQYLNVESLKMFEGRKEGIEETTIVQYAHPLTQP